MAPSKRNTNYSYTVITKTKLLNWPSWFHLHIILNNYA